MRGITHKTLIATGGFGEVHKMHDERTGEVFARKILRTFGDVTREDIDNEARAVSELCAPGKAKNVVEVMRHGWLPHHSSYYYIDMEYCSETLEEWIIGVVRGEELNLGSGLSDPEPEIGGPRELIEWDSFVKSDVKARTINSFENMDAVMEFDWEPVLNIIDDIVCALIYIHGTGTVHRDMKPRNVLFSQKDKCWKIADFGTASRATSKRLNTTRYSRGTASYRSPEILDGSNAKYNNKTDIFALGCIIYEIVTGTKLFFDDMAILNYSLTGVLGLAILWPKASLALPDRLRCLERLVSSMLEIDPLGRPNAREVQTQLASIRAGTTDGRTLFPSGVPLQQYLTSRPILHEAIVPQQSSIIAPKRLPFSRRAQPSGAHVKLTEEMTHQQQPTQAERVEKLTRMAKELGGALLADPKVTLSKYQTEVMVLAQQNMKRFQHAGTFAGKHG